MEVNDGVHVHVGDASAVGEARRRAVELAAELGFAEQDVGRVAIIVTEAGTNLVKHAGGGEVLVRRLDGGAGSAVGVLALDRGPGIRDVGHAMRDGVSSAGTAGNGLGAIARLASRFEVYAGAGVPGAALLARIEPSAAPPPTAAAMCAGGIAVVCPGERVCGDAWAVVERDGSTWAVVADGLGHGALAAEASREAVAAFRRDTSPTPAGVLESIHLALRATRGAAVAVAQVDTERRVLHFAGIGNIAGSVLANGKTRSLVSHHGTAGHQARRIQSFSYPWDPGAQLVLHSDGLTSRWTLDRYPGVLARDPMLLAAILYRDFARGRDDTTVVVLREAA